MDNITAVCHVLLKSAVKKGLPLSQKIEGESMLPTLKPGQEITIEHIKPESASLGDVLVFQGNFGDNVVHRLVKIKQKNSKTLYITKGDNNLAFDPPFEASRILGCVSKIEGRSFAALESQAKRQMIVKGSLRQAKIGKALLLFLKPLYRAKVALIGNKSLGVVKLLRKLTRPI